MSTSPVDLAELAHCGTGGGRIAALRQSSTATMAGGDADDSTKTLSTQSFPQRPGEEPHAHAATQYKEAAEARLAEKGLLAVAQGEEHSSVKAIVDVDLSSLPALPTTHRDHHRREEARTKIEAQNKANDEKRFTLTMQAWTEVYALYKASTEKTAPLLSRASTSCRASR